MKKHLHLIIKGRVQGVFYRQSTRKKALDLELTGYVKNLPNGNVEVVAEGEEIKLQQLLEWCKRGPQYSEVEKIEEQWSEHTTHYNNFFIFR
jgi:acylphosphatase